VTRVPHILRAIIGSGSYPLAGVCGYTEVLYGYPGGSEDGGGDESKEGEGGYVELRE